MNRHTSWAAVRVRARRAAGWVAWETTKGPLWARWRADADASLETEPMAPDEVEVVDDVLREEK